MSSERGAGISFLRGKVKTGAKRPLFLGVVLLFSAFLAGCANGTYPLDIFYEMHYQQSYGAHEPPRISVPEGAVPITGRQLSTTENPIAGQRVDEGARLFANNCTFCHGIGGRGDGVVLQVMRDKYNYPQSNPNGDYTITPDLTAEFVRSQPDVGIYAWITNGVTVMPPFNKLLTVEERWLLVNYIRTLPQ